MPTTNQPLQHAARFLNSHKFGFYSFVSIIAVVGVITNALKNYSNFYSVTIFLSKSSRSILVTSHILPIAFPSDSSQRHWQILLFFSLFYVAILCNESSSARFDRMKLRYEVYTSIFNAFIYLNFLSPAPLRSALVLHYRIITSFYNLPR
jgi:hypothetical protein